MPVPLQIAVGVGVGIIFALYLIFKEKPRALTYSQPQPRMEYSDTYDTHPNQSRAFIAEECPICQDNLSIRGTKTLTCKHVYHEACINKWFEQSRDCPVCRKRC